MKYTVYILRMTNNQLYIGQTKDLANRLTLHKKHKGAKFTKDNYNFKLAYTEEFDTQIEAMRREKQLKGWTRAKKEALIARDFVALKKL
ncbi:MAG: GIY-YIG nuclease family protein [Patescibacteria group bacterium]|nr:GIY-YIG nuclease family protein [Patescibacteria group bacterium]